MDSDLLRRILGIEPNFITLLFTALSVYQAWQGVRLAGLVRRQKAAFLDGPLTDRVKRVADSAAFLLGVPPGVFIHELGHAVAVWLFGGRVVTFRVWFYWGFVVPAGNFSAAQDWFISLAGTLGSLLYAGLLALALARAQRPNVRYFLLRAVRFQLIFALIYYPVFTAVTFIGDWRVIYDFGRTPLLSTATAVGHAAALLLYLWADRRGVFEMVGSETVEQQARQMARAAAAAHNPHDHAARLAAIRDLIEGGALRRAQTELQRLIHDAPQLAEAHLLLGIQRSVGQRGGSARAVAPLQQALALGLTRPRDRALAHLYLGRHYLERERVPEAARHADDGAAALKDTGADGDLAAALWQLRGVALRRQGAYADAVAALERAAELATAVGDEAALQRIRTEQEIARHHGGRPGGPPAE